MQAAVHTRESRPAMTARRKLSAYVGAHQAASDRAAARDDGADDDPRAERALPDLWLLLATLVGGSLTAASRERLQLLHRPRHRPGHEAHPEPAAGHGRAEPTARPWSSRAVSAWLRSSWLWVFTTWLAALLSLVAILLLRARLHAHAQAPHLAEHRVGRRRRLHAGADRLGGRDRARSSWTPVILFVHRLPLDAAALLAALDALQATTTRRPACRCSPWCAAARRSACRSCCTPGPRSPARCCSSRSRGMGLRLLDRRRR